MIVKAVKSNGKYLPKTLQLFLKMYDKKENEKCEIDKTRRKYHGILGYL